MPCEPVSWRLLDMKTEAISATNWCRLVFPILQTQKVKFSAHRLGTQLAQVQLSEKAPLRAAQRPALRLPPNLPSNVTAADPASCHEDCARSALPSAGVPGVGPELHVDNVDPITVHVGVRVHNKIHDVAHMQRHLQLHLHMGRADQRH